jgi:nucleotide-binding universal stress UspA family protein
MLWNNILLAYDNSQSALRAAEYVGQMFGKVREVKVTLFSVYDKVPEFDMVDTHFTGQVKGRIGALEREREAGRQVMDEAKKHLTRVGFEEGQVDIKYVEKKKSVAKQIIEEAQRGGYGTVVMGRRSRANIGKMIFGSVSGSVVSNLAGATICVVE